MTPAALTENCETRHPGDARAAERRPVESSSRRPQIWKERAALVLVSLAVVIPCFWHSRIQAGDLSSHIYNAWLATLIEAGQVQGLAIAPLRTNVLFDLLLFQFLMWFGVDAAQRLAVSGAVLVFFWGAFAFASAVSGRRPWPLMPCLAMLTYGSVFHMGFFNFYLALGLCLWALALLWKPRSTSALVAALLLAIGMTAQAIPVAWAGSVFACTYIMRRMGRRGRVAFICLVSLGAFIAVRATANWLPLLFSPATTAEWVTRITGVDQVFVFGGHYAFLSAGLLCVWIVWWQPWRRTDLLDHIPALIFLLHAFIMIMLPKAIWLPGYNAALDFIPHRLSLMVALSVCALLAQWNPAKSVIVASTALLVVYFTCVYFDTRRLNEVEDSARNVLLSRLPERQRVIGSACYGKSRFNALLHAIDRACIGHCYSYGNYEPSSLAFRVQTSSTNPVVVESRMAVEGIELGGYVVRSSDLPLYQLSQDAGGEQMRLKRLAAGDVTQHPCADSRNAEATGR